MNKYIPINKGNYSMETSDRDADFEKNRGSGWDVKYQEYRRLWETLPSSLQVSEYPLLVDIELSSVCNLKCPMCYTITEEFGERVNTKRMDVELFKKIIDEIAGKVPAIRLSLRGEATLHPKFVELIRYAKQAGISEVSTLTHGGKLKPKYVEQIIDAGIDWITISVDGVWDTYEKIRKPLKFEDLYNNIKSIHEIKKKRKLVKPVIKVQGIWPAIRENPTVFYDTFAPYVDQVAFNPLIDYLGNDTESDITFEENFTCPQQYQRLVIGADGLVMKCSNDEENREVIGDIRLETVHEVWHGKKMSDVRLMQMEKNGFARSEVCRKCYLPRKTESETAVVGSRTFTVKNYVSRSQIIGQ